MGERLFGELLERLDKSFPKVIKEKELLKEGFPKSLIDTCLADELVNRNFSEPFDYILSAEGFLLLNQIRMKKTIELLNKSIKKFDEASSKASRAMYWLTFMITVLTAFLAFLTFISFFKG